MNVDHTLLSLENVSICSPDHRLLVIIDLFAKHINSLTGLLTHLQFGQTYWFHYRLYVCIEQLFREISEKLAGYMVLNLEALFLNQEYCLFL